MSERFVSLVNDQRAALLGALTDLAAEDWGRSTGCRGWSVHDVVAHLVEGELLFGRVYRGELAEVTEEHTDPQAGVDRWTRADGETLRFSLWHHGSATQRVIDSRSEASWRRPVTLVDRLMELRHVLRMHLFDLAIHSHDVTATLGVPSLWGDRAAVLVEYCVRGAPVALDTACLDRTAAVRVDVSGVGSWALDHRNGSWALTDPESDTEVAWFTDAETLVLATTGRLAAADAIERSTVDGDADLLAGVLHGWQVKRG